MRSATSVRVRSRDSPTAAAWSPVTAVKRSRSASTASDRSVRSSAKAPVWAWVAAVSSSTCGRTVATSAATSARTSDSAATTCARSASARSSTEERRPAACCSAESVRRARSSRSASTVPSSRWASEPRSPRDCSRVSVSAVDIEAPRPVRLRSSTAPKPSSAALTVSASSPTAARDSALSPDVRSRAVTTSSRSSSVRARRIIDSRS